MKVLIFPCNTFEAITKARELKIAGHQVIGATSVASEYTLDDTKYEQVFELPYITNPEFESDLQTLLETHSVDYIWSSIVSVNSKLPEYLAASSTQILSADPVALYNAPIKLIREQVGLRKEYQNRLHTGLKLDAQIPEHMLVNILTAVHKVSGESHFDKLFTIANIFSTMADDTDIVEIGSLWGRTAKAFCCLSLYHGKGNVLCIDPWSHGEAVTQNSHKILDDLSLNVDGDAHFDIFVSNLLAEHYGKINYLRGFSADVAPVYSNDSGIIESPEFGQTKYSKKIGLLHIDGNHKYENVVEDIDNYASSVVPGGWIIFDDYNWAYGDGVTKAADQYLEQNIDAVEVAFFSGGALFVKLQANN